MKLNKNKAKKILKDVAPEKSFWINNGPVIKNIKELPGALRKMKKDTFMHHVNKNKNDFGRWVKDVVGDAALATRISRLKTKTPMASRVSKRVKMLKKRSG